MAQTVSPGQLSLLDLGPLILESPVGPPRADGSPFPRSRSRWSSPWRTTPGVRAVSLRPSPVPSRPAGRIQPEGPARGSGVCSWPGPAVPASPGCRRHRWTPNTSRPRLPPVTSGSQKTGCANRGLHVWTFGEETPSTALGGPVRNIPVGRRGSMSMAPTYWATGAA